MSLCCHETGRILQYPEKFYVMTHVDGPLVSAVAKEVIDNIPKGVRRTKPCTEGEKGVNIHAGKSRRNGPFFADAWAWSGLKAGKFFFSLDQEAAERYLPNYVASRYPGKIRRRHKAPPVPRINIAVIRMTPPDMSLN